MACHFDSVRRSGKLADCHDEPPRCSTLAESYTGLNWGGELPFAPGDKPTASRLAFELCPLEYT